MSWHQEIQKTVVDTVSTVIKKPQRHDENEQRNDKENIETHNCNIFPSSSNCDITLQQSTLLFLCEKRNKLMKLLETGSGKNEAFKAQEKNDNELGKEDNQLDFEETDELPLETTESTSEEDKDNEDEWNVVDENQCTLDGVCGLNEIKESLFNILIYPSVYPQFFPRRIRWNQILLYGPPGTGKSMLVKALAFEIKATLHRLTSADLLSHWQGQTEKQIRSLFQEIQSNPDPKILFFDEIDGLFRRRTNDENDSTRRIKTELLIHLDDFTTEFENHRAFLIGATNCPWEIDPSFMRRFHKKIFVPLPDKKARLDIIKRNFESIETDLTELEWSIIGDKTEGYSGSDLVNVVMTSCCERFMDIKSSKYWEARGDFWFPVRSYSLFSSQMNFEDIHPEKIAVRNIIFSDMMEAIAKTAKTVESEALLKYLEFSKKNKIE